MSFDKNVFINCPFDDGYSYILQAIVFCILELDFEPRIALERLDSAESRIEKIIELIEGSKYAIHDLSRLKAATAGEFYRLNMPFELGLDVGCRRFKGGQWKDKRCLILEAERYRYQAALSDLSNSDIAVHQNEPSEAMREVRNWLAQQAKLKPHGPAQIWQRFNEFLSSNYDRLKARGFSDRDIEKQPINELIDDMKEWIADHRV